MSDVLIGRGAVGKALLLQRNFDQVLHSQNIKDFSGHSFDKIYCAAGSAKKWLANKDGEADYAHINSLIDDVLALEFGEMILISTVDVFGNPFRVTEYDEPIPGSENFYGKNRLMMENRISEECHKRGVKCSIFRLGGLVGPTISKNILYDVSHGKIVEANPHSSYQYYDLTHLNNDIETLSQHSLVHLTSEPVSMKNLHFSGIKDWKERIVLRDDLPRIEYAVLSIHYQLPPLLETMRSIRSYDQYVNVNTLSI